MLGATLELHIARPAAGFGRDPVRGLAVYRLMEGAWHEGDGHVYRSRPRDRGEGPGATWACAVDEEIANRRADCAAGDRWHLGRGGSGPAPWSDAPTDRVSIVNRQTGRLSLDVTADVLAWMAGEPAIGWVLAVDAGDDPKAAWGTVLLSSREGDDPPRLRLRVGPSEAGG